MKATPLSLSLSSITKSVPCLEFRVHKALAFWARIFNCSRLYHKLSLQTFTKHPNERPIITFTQGNFAPCHSRFRFRLPMPIHT